MHVASYISILLVIIVIIFLIHSVIPTYYNKKVNKKVIKNISGEKKVMLTFDDGPDERYTWELLDVLKDNNIKAIFFVVAKNAKRNPDIIRKMVKQGHIVALHSLEHKNAWLYSYWYTKKDFEKSIDIMKEIGVKINYYRPPWGYTNIFSNIFVKKYNLNMVLWDLMINDWEKNTTVEMLVARLVRNIHSHSIICVHDSGENSGGAKGAPKIMIDALKIAIQEIKASGYKFDILERR